MKSKMTGWKDVYNFTLKQKVKGKSFKILTIIIVLIAVMSMPVVSMLTEKKEAATTIDGVYVLVSVKDINTQDFINELQLISNENEMYRNIKYIPTTQTYDELSNEIENANEQYHKIVANISYQESGLTLTCLYGNNTAVKESDVNNFSVFLNENLTDVLVNNLGITNDQLAYINTPIVNTVELTNETGEVQDNETIQPLNMALYTIGCFVFAMMAFILSISSEGITSSIIMEKSSRVIEYIMISIKPMAIVVGKVLSALTLTLIEIAFIIVGIIISVTINLSGMPSAINNLIENAGLNHISIGALLLAIVIMVFGFLLYYIIAALLGATVSKIEEATEATKIYMTFMFIGIYMSIALIMMQMFGVDVGIYEYIVFLFPFSSAIALPFYLIIGKASMIVGIIALMIILLSLVWVTLFVSRVYGYIIYHTGSPIKIKDLFKISKELKKGAN